MRSSVTSRLPAAREQGSTEKAPGGSDVVERTSARRRELTGVYDAAARKVSGAMSNQSMRTLEHKGAAGGDGGGDLVRLQITKQLRKRKKVSINAQRG